MFTGKTEQPCCLCEAEDTATRIDLPPRAVQLMKHGDPIAWRDIDGDVSIHFCQSDWDLVRELVLEIGTNPLSRCNVAHASFDLRADFEALLNEIRDEPDQTALEARLLEQARTVERDHDRGDTVEDRALVEARIVRWSLEDLGVVAAGDTVARSER
jgi:hypothetical protein